MLKQETHKNVLFKCHSWKHIHSARCRVLDGSAEIEQRCCVWKKNHFASGWVVTFGVAVEFFTHRVYSEICIYYIAVLPNRCAARHSLPKRMFVPGLRSSCKNEMALAPELCLKHGSGCAFLIHFNNFGMPCVLLEQVNVLFQHILN